MTKQTAVEWLGKELERYGDPGYCKLEWETLDSLIQQAKETEKEQIIEAFQEGQWSVITSEEYYNKTFRGVDD